MRALEHLARATSTRSPHRGGDGDPETSSRSRRWLGLALPGLLLTATGLSLAASGSKAGAEGSTGSVVAYVANMADGTLSALNTSDDTAIGSPDSVPGARIASLVASKDGTTLYVGQDTKGDGSVSSVNTSTGQVVGDPVTLTGNPTAMALSPDGATLYVLVDSFPGLSSSLLSFATSTMTQTGDVPAGMRSSGLAISPDGKNAYVTDTFRDVLVHIDLATGNTDDIPVGSRPVGVALTPDGTQAYVTEVFDDAVTVVDTATDTVVPPSGSAPALKCPIPFTAPPVIGPPVGPCGGSDTIEVGSEPTAVAFTPDGTKAYVTNSDDGTVSVIDTTTLSVTSTVPVGAWPAALAMTPDGTKVYVTNSDDGTVSVVDTATDTVSASSPITVGNDPGAIAMVSLPTPSVQVDMNMPSGTDPRGSQVTVSGSGFAPGSSVTVQAHSTPETIGTPTVGSDGSFSGSVTIPTDLAPGTHTVTASGTGWDGAAVTITSATFTVPDSAAPAPPAPPAAPVIPGATTPHTGEPWSGSGPYVAGTLGLGTALIALGLVLRRRERRLPA